MGNLVSYDKCKCLIPHAEAECKVCKGSGKCPTCDGTGIIVAKMEGEVFSYILDKKGAYRDFKEPPKQCPKCGGWGGVPIYRGALGSAAPTAALMSGQRTKMGEHQSGDGQCRTCKGSGKVLVPPDWATPKIETATYTGGMLMTNPQKIGPLAVSPPRR